MYAARFSQESLTGECVEDDPAQRARACAGEFCAGGRFPAEVAAWLARRVAPRSQGGHWKLWLLPLCRSKPHHRRNLCAMHAVMLTHYRAHYHTLPYTAARTAANCCALPHALAPHTVACTSAHSRAHYCTLPHCRKTTHCHTRCRTDAHSFHAHTSACTLLRTATHYRAHTVINKLLQGLVTHVFRDHQSSTRHRGSSRLTFVTSLASLPLPLIRLRSRADKPHFDIGCTLSLATSTHTSLIMSF
jgi:hypothetical protein